MVYQQLYYSLCYKYESLDLMLVECTVIACLTVIFRGVVWLGLINERD